MTGVRRAFLMNTAERYSVLAVQFLIITVVSRLLTPAEIGISVVGSGIMTMALSLREFATSEFLVQRKEVTRDDVRTSFTVLLLLNLLISGGLFVLTPWVAGFYGEDALARFLHVTIAACLIETVVLPVTALLRRNMAFGTLATINAAAAIVGALVSVTLAALGFSYMSFAWALLASSTTTTVLSLCFRPDFWIFRPSLRAWRSALAFGGFNGATIVLTRVYDALPQLVLGRFLPLATVGLYNRAVMICGIADRVILSGVFSVAYPAFAGEVRKGSNLKDAYLQGLGYITVLYWPAFVVLGLLAQPIVTLLLGDQWLDIVPLVRIISAASVFWFPVILTYPVLVSLGAIRDNLMAKLVSVVVCGPILCLASMFGLVAMALSQFLTLPFQMIVALWFVRRHVPFQWKEIPAAIGRSAAVTVFSAIGPAGVIASARTFDISIGAALFAGGLAALGWGAGLLVTHHPFAKEIRTVGEGARRSALACRMMSMWSSPTRHTQPAKMGESP